MKLNFKKILLLNIVCMTSSKALLFNFTDFWPGTKKAQDAEKSIVRTETQKDKENSRLMGDSQTNEIFLSCLSNRDKYGAAPRTSSENEKESEDYPQPPGLEENAPMKNDLQAPFFHPYLLPQDPQNPNFQPYLNQQYMMPWQYYGPNFQPYLNQGYNPYQMFYYPQAPYLQDANTNYASGTNYPEPNTGQLQNSSRKTEVSFFPTDPLAEGFFPTNTLGNAPHKPLVSKEAAQQAATFEYPEIYESIFQKDKRNSLKNTLSNNSIPIDFKIGIWDDIFSQMIDNGIFDTKEPKDKNQFVTSLLKLRDAKYLPAETLSERLKKEQILESFLSGLTKVFEEKFKEKFSDYS